MREPWKSPGEKREEGQIKKLGHNEYVINPEWIRDLKKFGEVVEQRQEAFRVFE